MAKVLVIEDDKSIAELERDYLEINGYECDVAEDGAEGLNLALEKDYACIILDIMLPSMNGFEICTKIREEKDTPLIMLSAKNEDIDKIRGLGLGADDYMTKPFSPNELMARVKSHIARFERLTKGSKSMTAAGSVPEEKIVVRGLEIHKDSRRVFLNGEEKIMPVKEFDILLFLAENPNRVFSKDHIFDRVWGIEALGDVSTVTVHIRRLREKIECENDQEQYIETVWGAGYRFKG